MGLTASKYLEDEERRQSPVAPQASPLTLPGDTPEYMPEADLPYRRQQGPKTTTGINL